MRPTRRATQKYESIPCTKTRTTLHKYCGFRFAIGSYLVICTCSIPIGCR